MGGVVNTVDDILSSLPGIHADLGTELALKINNAVFGKSSRTGPGVGDGPPIRDVNQSVNSTVAPANLVYGNSRIGGVFSFYGLSGTNNEYLWYSLAVACHEVVAISNLVIDGNFIPQASFTGNDVTSGMYSGLVSMWVHLGTTTQTADSHLTGAFGASTPPYTSAFTGLEVAYIVVRFKRDDTAFTQVPQNVQVDVQGKKVYDPRLDSTVTGGSGSQRSNNPATWAFSNNAVLCIRDYLFDSLSRGCAGWPVGVFNDPAIITQANIADQSIAYVVSGVTLHQNNYTIDGFLTTDQLYSDNLALMLNCINGTLDAVNGSYTPVCGQYNAPSFSLDESWFVAPVKCQLGAKGRDQYNCVKGKYYDNQQNYQQLDYCPFVNSTYIAADGIQKWKDLDLSLSTDLYRCQRLATLVGRQSRNQQVVNLSLDWRGLQLALGDAFNLTIANLFTNKVFVVQSISVQFTGNGLLVQVDALEDSSAAHTWNSGDAFTVSIPVNPSIMSDSPMDPTACTVVAKQDGYHISWTPPADGIYYYIEVWRSFTSSFAGASLAMRIYGDSWIDTSLDGVQAWYWVRAVSLYRQKSINYSPSSGGAGATDTWNPKVSKWSSRVRHSMLVGDAAGFYAVAMIPGTGSGSCKGQLYTHIGYNSTAASGILIKWGVNGSGNGSFKLEYCNQFTTVITQARIRQNATTGDAYLELNFVAPATVDFCIDTYPDEGTYTAGLRPISVFLAHVAGAATTIIAAQTINAGVTGHFHSSGAGVFEFTDGSKYRNGVTTWDTDGMVASQFRNPALIGPGYAMSYITGLTVTPHPTSINLSAFTLHLGQETQGYNSSSKTGLANSTLYHMYCVDKTMAGGAITLNATTSGQVVINNNANVYICDATTQSAGGTGGGGGAGGCVAADMFLAKRLRARYAHVGDWLDSADNFKKTGYTKIRKCFLFCTPCTRLEAEDGSVLICSDETPFTLDDGTSVLAPKMIGKKVLTDSGVSTIVKCDSVGAKHIMRIDCGGISFAAGEDPTKRIYSHNTQKP